MKTDLSSQITLTRIPQRYYRPENAFEHSVLTRLEKIPTNIYESADEGSFAIAKEIADQIRKKQEIGENFVMAIPGATYFECRRFILLNQRSTGTKCQSEYSFLADRFA